MSTMGLETNGHFPIWTDRMCHYKGYPIIVPNGVSIFHILGGTRHSDIENGPGQATLFIVGLLRNSPNLLVNFFVSLSC